MDIATKSESLSFSMTGRIDRVTAIECNATGSVDIHVVDEGMNTKRIFRLSFREGAWLIEDCYQGSAA